jgi:cation diffusion facilitator CzcD-associated flavoprotein CzcO
VSERTETNVAIIGAGLSGMAAGLRLQRDGVPFTIFEKGSDVGGTWRENRYPGLTIDVPSPIYTFRDYRHGGWRRWMPEQPEIYEYFRDVATRSGLRRAIRFNTAVTAASWDGEAWVVQLDDGTSERYRVLVCAQGFLHHPRWPEIPGLDSFAGELVHSAQWREEIVTTGKRVGVVGTGSTGTQLVGALAGSAAHVTQFQRTAQWIFPFPNFNVPGLMRSVLSSRPSLVTQIGDSLERFGDAVIGVATRRPGAARRVMDTVARLHLRTVRDPELRRRLTPDEAPLCKRPVVSLRFYRAVQRPDVSVVDAGIDHVCPEGVITADGRLHELDVLILATGFDAHAYMRRIAITGRDGVTLEQAWADGPHGYRTVSLAGFPNLFMVMGPHSPLLSVSIHASAELQSDYIAQMLEVLDRDGVVAVEPSPEATTAWMRSIRDGVPGTLWASGCRSWYLGDGDTPVLWPYDRSSWFELLRTPDLADYEIQTTERVPITA